MSLVRKVAAVFLADLFTGLFAFGFILSSSLVFDGLSFPAVWVLVPIGVLGAGLSLWAYTKGLRFLYRLWTGKKPVPHHVV